MGHHYRSCTSGKTSLPPGPATLPSNTDRAVTRQLPPTSLLAGNRSRLPDDHAEMGNDYYSSYQIYGYSTESFQINHLMLEVQRPPRPREPGKEKFRGGFRRASDWTLQHTPHGWQKPRRTSQLDRQWEPFTLPLTNRFSQLPETELASEVNPDIGGEHTSPPSRKPHPQRPLKPRAKRAPHQVAKTKHAREVRVQAHKNSYFLPGKVTGRDVTFLLDSGCTTNLLSRRVFNTLPLKERKELAPYTVEPSTLADGSSIPFDDVIELIGRVRD